VLGCWSLSPQLTLPLSLSLVTDTVIMVTGMGMETGTGFAMDLCPSA